MPTVTGSASWLFENHLYLAGHLTYGSGDTDYDGHTQAGTPATAQTDNDVLVGQLKIGYGFQLNPRWLVIPYLTYGHRYWNRGLGGAVPYHEKYNDNFVGVGAELDFRVRPGLTASATLMGGTTFGSQIDIKMSEVSPLYSDASLDLGSDAIVKVGLGLDYRVHQHWHVFGQAQYTHFSYGASNWQTVARQGSRVLRVREPDSTTDNFGVRVGVRYRF